MNIFWRHVSNIILSCFFCSKAHACITVFHIKPTNSRMQSSFFCMGMIDVQVHYVGYAANSCFWSSHFCFLFASLPLFARASRPLRGTLLLTLFLRFYNNNILFSPQCAAKHFFHHESQQPMYGSQYHTPRGVLLFLPFCLFLFFPFFREVSSSLFLNK